MGNNTTTSATNTAESPKEIPREKMVLMQKTHVELEKLRSQVEAGDQTSDN